MLPKNNFPPPPDSTPLYDTPLYEILFEQSKMWYRPVPKEEEEQSVAYRHIFFLHHL
jgi:hypothetical protein